MSKMTEAQTMLFIDLYHSHRFLWDTSNPDYKDKAKREEALKDILKHLKIPGFTVSDVKMKIKNVRSHYCQELKKVRDSTTGDNGAPSYRPTLPWFPIVDGFLKKYVEQNTAMLTKRKLMYASGGPHEPDDEDSQLFISENDTDIKNAVYFPVGFTAETVESPADLIEDPLNLGSHFENSVPLRVDGPTKTSDVYYKVPRRLQRQGVSEQGLTAALGKLQEIADIATGIKTEFDIFGAGVASQLNAMPWEQALELQLQIQSLITTYRLDKHRNSNQPPS